jgi:hydrogenase maturation protease
VHLLRDTLPEARHRSRLRLIGVGNRWRGDDAAGLVVAAAVAARRRTKVEVLEHEGEPLELIEACQGADEVWMVDAVSSDAPAGTLHRFEAGDQPLPSALFRVSTHRLGLAEALELARTLGRLPPRVVVHGIEGARFDPGLPLSPEVADAAERLTRTLVADLELREEQDPQT